MSYPQPYRPAGPPVKYAAPPTNTLAVVSLAAGVSAFVITHFVGALVAVVTGHMARGQIRQSGENGGGLALAGLILGYVYFVLLAVVVVAVVLFVLGFGAFLFSSSHSG